MKNKEYTIATLASHSALQILKGAKDEGFATCAISLSGRASFYKKFPFINSIISIENYAEFYDREKELRAKDFILIPHGSINAYLGPDYGKRTSIAHFGNKEVLSWEIDREKQMEWLKKAELRVPKVYKNPSNIDRPVIVKMFGAKGGSGYFIAGDKKQFDKKISKFSDQKFIIQEYIVGTPVYLQYFYSPIKKSLELMGIDRRYESNVDGLARIPSNMDDEFRVEPSYTVIGNFPIVVRESLLPEIYSMGEKLVSASQKLMPPKGLYGPFCIETIVTPDQLFYTIEISCRIVAGTNLFINGSPYSYLTYGIPMSTGRRIAREIKEAAKKGFLSKILD